MKKTPIILVAICALFFLSLPFLKVKGELNGLSNTADVAAASRGTNAAGLTSWYKLDGGGGSGSIDYGTNQANGLMVNGVVTDADGQIIGCTRHPGGTSIIRIGKCGLNSIATSNTSPWTFSAWFITTNAAGQDIYSEGNSTNSSGNQFIRFMTSRSVPGDYAFSLRYDSGAGLLIASTTGAGNTNANNNQWHMFTVTHPSPTNWVIYVDGALKQTNFTTSILPLTLDHAAIGALRRNTEQSAFLGKIDDVRLYNRTLDLQEITNLYNKIAP